MVFFKSFLAAAALTAGVVNAAPRPQQDSALGIEVAVSAPFGIPLTDGVELASQSSFEAAQSTAAASSTAVVAATATPAAGEYGAAPPASEHPASSAPPAVEYPASSAPPAAEHPSSSTTAWNTYSTPSYGSGNSNWGGSGYDDCVNQCMASYGAATPAVYKPTATSGSEGSVGTGATHTVVVAPTQGVLRYIPFALNASVGDTVKFMWGANNHTVTKGTSLTPCNRSGEAFFASGLQVKDFVFTQVVNDTNPTYFYCAAPTHCQKGMFGIINPPSNSAAATSVSQMMQPLSANNSNVAAYVAYSKEQTAGDEKASRWGGSIDMADLPEWAHQYVAENVLYTRNFLAANKEVLKDDGSVDLSNAGTTPLMIPEDLSVALNNAGASTAVTPAANAASEAPSAPAASETAAGATSGAIAISSSRVLVGAVVAAVTFFSL